MGSCARIFATATAEVGIASTVLRLDLEVVLSSASRGLLSEALREEGFLPGLVSVVEGLYAQQKPLW